MYEAGSVTAMLYLILMAAPIFTYFINLAHVPEHLVHWIEGHQFPPLGVIFTLTVVYILLGTFFEEMSSILITLPLVLPIIVNLGYDPLWWGVICLIQVEMALIHPPMGIIVFLLHAIAPKISMSTIYRGVVPFLIADFAVLILLILLPGDRSLVAAHFHALKPMSGASAVRSGPYCERDRAPHFCDAACGRSQQRQELVSARSIVSADEIQIRDKLPRTRAPTQIGTAIPRCLRIDLAVLDRIALGADRVQQLRQALRLARSPVFRSLRAR